MSSSSSDEAGVRIKKPERMRIKADKNRVFSFMGSSKYYNKVWVFVFARGPFLLREIHIARRRSQRSLMALRSLTKIFLLPARIKLICFMGSSSLMFVAKIL